MAGPDRWKTGTHAEPATGTAPAEAGEGRRGEMTALDWVLVVAIIVLAAFLVAGLVLGARALRALQTNRNEVKDRQDQVDVAKAKAASVRAEAAAAKAEANAARAEARRVLEAAHEEADTLLEHAHPQAEAGPQRVRPPPRRPAGRIDERKRLQGEEVERLVQRERRLAAMDADLAAREAALSGREAELAAA